jgi:N-methylhydantoinase A
MGGTSTDVALIDGEPALTREGEIAGYPVAVAMVDMHTIGAGGGSVAWIDEGGLLQVGPRSAGADPGPACYGRGGVEPTVTDANLLLGRLPLDGALAGSLRLDREAARAALARLAEGLGLGVEAAALGVLRLADAHMAEALRVISVRRGLDPADYTLLPFGGAGGLHVCALAEAIGAREALVPVHGGVLSALGMLAAPPARQRAQTLIGPLAERRPEEIEAGFAALAAAARAELAAEGVTQPREQRTLELRYVGQSSTLTLPWRGVAQDIAQGIAQGVEDFHAAHEAAFGHRLDMPVELVNLGIGLTGEAPALALPGPAPGPAARARSRQAVFGCARPAEVYTRAELACDQRIAGPALIAEPLATTYIAPGWGAQVDAVGNLVLHPA